MQVVGVSTRLIPSLEKSIKKLKNLVKKSKKRHISHSFVRVGELPEEGSLFYSVVGLSEFNRLYPIFSKMTSRIVVLVFDSALNIHNSGIHSLDTENIQVYRFILKKYTHEEFARKLKGILTVPNLHIVTSPLDYSNLPRIIGRLEGRVSQMLLNLTMNTDKPHNKKLIGLAFYDWVTANTPDVSVFIDRMVELGVSMREVDHALDYFSKEGKPYRKACIEIFNTRNKVSKSGKPKTINYKAIGKKFKLANVGDIKYFFGFMRKMGASVELDKTTTDMYWERQKLRAQEEILEENEARIDGSNDTMEDEAVIEDFNLDEVAY